MTRRGISIAEALVVVLIIGLLTALLTPLLARARRSAEIQSSMGRLRQLYVGVEIYRQEYGGTDGNYESLAVLGLPNWDAWNKTLLGFDKKFLTSPCGYEETLYDTGPGQYPGFYCYGPAKYDPATNILGGPGLPRHVYYGYLSKYRQNAVMWADAYCNPAGTDLRQRYASTRGLAVLLSGQMVNKYGPGGAGWLFFYSDPPEE